MIFNSFFRIWPCDIQRVLSLSQFQSQLQAEPLGRDGGRWQGE